jgi:hypothetical protein
MNKQLSGSIGAALIAAALIVLSVPVDAAEMRCDVPFSFEVNNATLPPGAYSVSTEQGTLLIRGATRGALSVTNRTESRADTSPKLVFHRYGDEYILREVWTGGSTGRLLSPSRRERQLANASRRGDVAAFERVVIPIS